MAEILKSKVSELERFGKITPEAADKLRSVIYELDQAGGFPSKKLNESPFSEELAQKVNNACGAELDDEISLISLSSAKNLESKRKLAKLMPEKYDQASLENPPDVWTEFRKQLKPEERGVINRMLNNLADHKLTLGDIREMSIDELQRIRNLGEDSAVFIKKMFTPQSPKS